MTLYLWVGEPTWLITDSTWINRILGGSGKKLTRLKFIKKFQPNLAQTHDEPGWLADSNSF